MRGQKGHCRVAMRRWRCPKSLQEHAILILSLRPWRLTGAGLARAGIVFGGTASASSQPQSQSLVRVSTSGSYLAARHAGIERDAAAAANYYRAALRTDPNNGELLARAFL